MNQCNDTELRAAIAAGGTIVLNCSGTIALTNQIVVTSNTTLDGSGGLVTIDGGSMHRLFVVQPGVRFAIRGLTLANGRGTNGGAILNNGGTVAIVDCVFTNNVSLGRSGADGTNGTNALPGTMEGDPDYNRAGNGSDGQVGESARGGAIASSGTLNITNTTFTGNKVVGGTGGNGGDGGNSGGTPFNVGSRAGSGGRSGMGGSASGGAIHNSGIAVLVNSTFVDCRCLGGNGGAGGNPGGSLYQEPVAVAAVGAVGGDASGGAIFSSGTLTVSNCTFTGNGLDAGEGGGGGSGSPVLLGGRANDGTNGASGGTALGGAIFAGGPSVFVRTMLTSNFCAGGTGGEGGFGANHTMYQGSAGGDGGIGGSAFGGALFVTGSGSVVECRLAFNRIQGGVGAMSGGGGWRYGLSGRGGKGGDAQGAAISIQDGTLTVLRSTVVDNKAFGGPGGTGRQTITVVTNNCGRGGIAAGAAIANRGQLIVDETSLLANEAAGGVGGHAEAAFTWFSPTSPANGALGGDAFGGGIFNAGPLMLVRSLVASNNAIGGTGGDGRIALGAQYQSGGNGEWGGSGFGGGLFSAAAGAVTNVTLCYNTAQGGAGGNGGMAGRRQDFECHSLSGGNGGGGGSGWGGGILLNSSSNLLKHVTIAYNAALAGDAGAGGPGLTACEGTTADGANGQDGFPLGGGIYAGVPLPTIEHVIVAYNFGGNISASSLNDPGVSLNSDSTYSFNSGLNNIDPLLGALGNHGGLTRTMPLLSGSPAIDKVPPAAGSATDQRGVARPSGTASDIGAHEANETLYGIVGRITASNEGVRGVSVTTSNLTAISDEEGYYRLGALIPGNYVATPMITGASFDPASRTVSVITNVFGADFAITNVGVRGTVAGSAGQGGWFYGLPGREYVLETSTTLTNWIIVVTNTAGADGRIRIVDPNRGTSPYRFYRAWPR